MKYVALWLGSVAALVLLALVGWAAALVVSVVVNDPSKVWIVAIAAGILAIATIVSVIEYLTDRRKDTEVEVIER